LLPSNKDVFVIATLSQSLFPQIAKTGIGDAHNIPAIAAPAKSHRNIIFSISLFSI
jgi:hypothetical protein